MVSAFFKEDETKKAAAKTVVDVFIPKYLGLVEKTIKNNRGYAAAGCLGPK